MSKLQFEKDESGELTQVFTKVINGHFPDLVNVNFLYTWRRSVKNKEGQTVLGEARKLNSRDRDLFKFDFGIEVWEKWWQQASEKDRERLAYHELSHCKLKYDEDGVMFDEYDRLVLAIEYHNLVVQEFKEVVEKFGMGESDEAVAGFYNGVRREKGVEKKARRK